MDTVRTVLSGGRNTRAALAAAVVFLLALVSGSFAGEIARGATMQVKPNSIWFQNAAQLARWQDLKKSGNTAALAIYQQQLLSDRNAWQFTNQLTVKVLNYDSKKRQVKVEGLTPGRFAGFKWVLDVDSFVR
jgi:hypothetical protein